MSYIVYKHIFPNGKIYIGITSLTSAIDRWGSNGIRYKGQLVGKAIKKYGWENVKHEILYTGLTKEQASEIEIDLIKYYNSTNISYGYNLTAGGEGGSLGYHKKLSEDTKKKIGNAHRGRKYGDRLTPEGRERLRISSTNRKKSFEEIEKIRNANLGRHHTQATKLKISEIQKNRTPEEKKAISNKLSESLKKSGKQRSEKRKETMKIKYPDGFKQPESSNIARSLAHKGVKKSEETKQKMRKPKSKEAIENMKKAQRLRREAEKLGITYSEYIGGK